MDDLERQVAEASGEATGWRKIDKDIYQRDSQVDAVVIDDLRLEGLLRAILAEGWLCTSSIKDSDMEKRVRRALAHEIAEAGGREVLRSFLATDSGCPADCEQCHKEAFYLGPRIAAALRATANKAVDLGQDGAGDLIHEAYAAGLAALKGGDDG